MSAQGSRDTAQDPWAQDPWFRVEFARRHAGGLLIKTWEEVRAESPEAALAKVRAADRGRRNTGSFLNAAVRPVLDSEEKSDG